MLDKISSLMYDMTCLKKISHFEMHIYSYFKFGSGFVGTFLGRWNVIHNLHRYVIKIRKIYARFEIFARAVDNVMKTNRQ